MKINFISILVSFYLFFHVFMFVCVQETMGVQQILNSSYILCRSPEVQQQLQQQDNKSWFFRDLQCCHRHIASLHYTPLSKGCLLVGHLANWRETDFFHTIAREQSTSVFRMKHNVSWHSLIGRNHYPTNLTSDQHHHHNAHSRL